MSTNFVFLSLGKSFSVSFLERIPTEFVVDGIEFNRLGEDFNGFYDWLRDDAGVIGLRYDIFELGNERRKNLEAFGHVNILKGFGDGGLTFEVLFFKERVYLPERSADQDFCEDYIYQARTGELGIIFALDDDQEFEELKRNWERRQFEEFVQRGGSRLDSAGPRL